LPIQLDVRGREALVIGGGGEVASKIARLVDAGAEVTLVAETLDPALEKEAVERGVRVERRPFQDADVEGKFVVYVAPGHDALAGRLHERAQREGRLLCTMDRPETCTFTSVAVVDVNGLVLTVSSDGASPGATRRIREDLERLFGEARFGRFMASLRRAREALPRGARAREMAEAVRGFAVEATLRFPSWFERDEDERGGPELPTRGEGTGV
jgi:precorrin-2 dehydrogenase / sirohydrochlorin ferrochelatase